MANHTVCDLLSMSKKVFRQAFVERVRGFFQGDVTLKWFLRKCVENLTGISGWKLRRYHLSMF